VTLIEAVKIWNEPNNMSHWDFEIDTGWTVFAGMAKLAGDAIAAERPGLPRVLGGISPIDPGFMRNMKDQGVLDHVDVVAVHGFPLDWNHWQIHEWPERLAEIQALTHLPVWITEVGVSTFGAEEVQEFGLKRTAELLIGKAPRIHWYSLYDLPKAWPGTARPKARPTTGISTWGSSRRTAPPSWRSGTSRSTRRRWASASGSTSRTTGSTTRSAA
jgi:beta-xylosidase